MRRGAFHFAQRLTHVSHSVWNLREHVDARANVFGTLGVVGGGRIHRVRPVLRPSFDEFDEIRLQRTRGARIAADFVQGNQRIVDVEKCVFESFGHDRAGELLPSHGEREAVFALTGKEVRPVPDQQYVSKKIEHLRIQLRGVAPAPHAMARSMRASSVEATSRLRR